MSRIAPLTIGDRIAAGVVGAVIGAIVGLVLAWLLGVYSNVLGPSQIVFGVPRFVLKVSAFFALVGLVFGPSVGTLLGHVISLIFSIESWESRRSDLPGWLVVPLIALLAFGVWWAFRQ